MSKTEKMEYVGDWYHDMVVSLVEGFRYEYCHECGLDLGAHSIEPDHVFGHPFARCLNPLTDAE